MARMVGEYVVLRLREWGVQRVFGYPGDSINGIMAGFDALGEEPRFVQVRHEEMASGALRRGRLKRGPLAVRPIRPRAWSRSRPRARSGTR